MTLFRISIAIVALGLLGAPSGLAAQGEQTEANAGQTRRERARAAFREGEQAYYAGRFAEALDRFSLAYELSARAELLYNIGTAHDRLGHGALALRAYREYLDARPEAPNREFVLARIAVLENPGAAQEPLVGEPGPSGEPEPSSGAESEVDEGEGEAGERESGGGAPVSGDLAEHDSGGPSVAGIALLGTAGAAGIAAVVTGVMALGQRSDLDEQCPGGDCDPALQGELDRLDRLTISTDVLIGVAAVAATVGVVLLVTSGEDEEQGFSAGCGLGHCEARVRW